MGYCKSRNPISFTTSTHTNYLLITIPLMKLHVVTTALLSALMVGCLSSTSQDVEADKISLPQRANEVKVTRLAKTNFSTHLISNGKLKAVRKSDLKFQVSGGVQKINVRNGQRIQQGSIIAQLDPFEYAQREKAAKVTYDKTRLALQDQLIGLGYDVADSANIPTTIWHTATLRSDYANAQRGLEDAAYQLRSSIIHAPFSGIIANLQRKVHEHSNAGEVFCVLIDDSAFEVEFHLVESEIHDIQLQDDVSITPFSTDAAYTGRISEINPLINEHGLILVKAIIQNKGSLLEGMNVKVTIKKESDNHLVVPKSAIVLRQNQEVLFKYVKGKAFWTYVKTGLENSDSFTVIPHPDKGGSLQAGDTIIISGNISLAHESDVVVLP
jgi:membrane fusion protein (multidrug efflux system)